TKCTSGSLSQVWFHVSVEDAMSSVMGKIVSRLRQPQFFHIAIDRPCVFGCGNLVGRDRAGADTILRKAFGDGIGRIDLFEDAKPEAKILPLADIGHIDLAELLSVINGGQATDDAGLE